jgi:hypothetical protein
MTQQGIVLASPAAVVLLLCNMLPPQLLQLNPGWLVFDSDQMMYFVS